MTDIPTIQVEAKLTRHSKRADGGINIGLAIHPHGIPSQLRNAELGDRYLIVLVQLDENEQPVEAKEEPAHESPRLSPNDARVASPVDSDKRLAQRAGILCNDPRFHRFLEKTYSQYLPNGCSVKDTEDAATLVRFLCQVDSRSDIKPGTKAGDLFERLILNPYAGWLSV